GGNQVLADVHGLVSRAIEDRHVRYIEALYMEPLCITRSDSDEGWGVLVLPCDKMGTERGREREDGPGRRIDRRRLPRLQGQARAYDHRGGRARRGPARGLRLLRQPAQLSRRRGRRVRDPGLPRFPEAATRAGGG